MELRHLVLFVACDCLWCVHWGISRGYRYENGYVLSQEQCHVTTRLVSTFLSHQVDHLMFNGVMEYTFLHSSLQALHHGLVFTGNTT